MKVTLDHIYATQQEMAITLAEIKGSLALQAQQDRNDAATLADHESRIRKIEVKVYAFPSLATLLAAAGLAYQLLS